MEEIKDYLAGIILTILLALTAKAVSTYIPMHIISASVFALILGMLLNPIIKEIYIFNKGIKFVSKKILKTGIVLMGLTLSFSQVLSVGGYSLIVMTFTLMTAFGGGYLVGRLFNMNWKLSSLISAGTGVCGGSAIAAVAPTIEAENSDIAYAISATFIFDILMVILFPIAGRYLGMSDLGFGLWAGTAVNDTSSVVAAGYAFSDAAGSFAVIVKLTRTLSIVPIVMIFSIINARENRRLGIKENEQHEKVSIRNIFPYFILLFLVMVAVKSTGIISADLSNNIASISKFMMVMALGAIGLTTNFNEVSDSGIKPLFHGFIISSLVVIVSFTVQMFIGQL
ncbi:Putative membrane protein YeiH [Halanaerobium saccharolyticum subsp. saccharolyticum DSM 6643]|uniref:Putative membrane protein YeiH n=1 Tax=Halanaerobium saccharolyticum subsp. saccharolyticum DSM 6643 TaxID=1293054 RepID=M5DYP0_9FIRM|nr:YeiH family protein [Halanaerobium saccharolyticum]CCU78128.1 Putative membrane protein YeiH [Halanaerobium saccharolyticum subsp. saccharolyticum DSM 6643]